MTKNGLGNILGDFFHKPATLASAQKKLDGSGLATVFGCPERKEMKKWFPSWEANLSDGQRFDIFLRFGNRVFKQSF
jgi:hypothetical protein